MLFGKKKQEELIQLLDEVKREVSLKEEKTEKLLNDRMDELQKIQKRQIRSLEDFLEEEQERTDRGEALKQKVQEKEEREKNLLSLAECYQEQLHLLRRQVQREFRGDECMASSWEKQFQIVDECLRRQMHSCALEKIGLEQEPVDLDCYQVLKIIDTEDDELDGRVAEVYNPGCIYHGEVIKKAQVAAYRRIKDGNCDRD